MRNEKQFAALCNIDQAERELAALQTPEVLAKQDTTFARQSHAKDIAFWQKIRDEATGKLVTILLGRHRKQMRAIDRRAKARKLVAG